MLYQMTARFYVTESLDSNLENKKIHIWKKSWRT